MAASSGRRGRTSSVEGGTPPASGAPAPGVLPTAVPVVAPGVEVRFRALVKMIKAQPAYNEGIGQALGIEGAAQTGPDFATFKPAFAVELRGGQVFIAWNWQGQSAYLDMIELLVDRSDGKGYVFLAQDTTPGYADSTGSPPHRPSGPTRPSSAWVTPASASGAMR
jgi:hypothetical protein